MSTTAHPKSLTIPASAVDVGYFSNKFALHRQVVGEKTEIHCASFLSVCPQVLERTSSQQLGGIGEPIGVSVQIDGQLYFVGPDAYLRGDYSDTRSVIENYAASDQYRALVKGALYYIAQHHLSNHADINRLVINYVGCGLPMTTIDVAKQDVLDAVNGDHHLPPLPGRTESLLVTVKNTLIIPQPQGALLNMAYQAGSTSAIDESILVVDLGGGTLDWFMTVNRKRSIERCGAHQVGILHAIRQVCDSIRPGLSRDTVIVDRVDRALRSRALSVKVSGAQVDLSPHLSLVDGVISKSLQKMMEKVGGFDTMDTILLTGGGAQLAEPILRKMLGARESIIKVDTDPTFSNVKGFFQLAHQFAHGRK